MSIDTARFLDNMRRYDIPEYMRKGLALYLTEGRRPRHFLTAVLENDLLEACARADDTNLQLLPAYVRFLFNHAPSASFGSPAKVDAWMAAMQQQRDERVG